MAVWKENKDWKYEVFERDIEPETLPGFEEIVRLWQGKRNGRPIPAWSDFDFHDFLHWHGRIAVLEVSYEPFDLRHRLFGEKIAERYQSDFTGKYLSELVKSGLEPAEDMEFYEMVTREMLIVRVSGELFWLRRPHVHTAFAEFPLSDNGRSVTHLLSAMV
jgi:hypothetical protein